tara:strand:- start:433 stop:735 length:303 start_codon:yes stop_codon:yes gene_type:complete
MATRQNSSSGKTKSPRIQVVLPEELCSQLSLLAENESRTVSNMAKVLIQEGILQRLGHKTDSTHSQIDSLSTTAKLISKLEEQTTIRLKGAPRKLKLRKP